MNPSRPSLWLATSLLAVCAIGPTAWAQTAATPSTSSAAVAAETSHTLPWVEAEVRRVDASAGKVTLKHGAIPNLDMPPMTMVFVANHPRELEAVQPGDRVSFSAETVNGQYRVVHLRKQP